MLAFLNAENISQYKFQILTGLSNGYLNSGKDISSKNLAIIAKEFPNLNLMWLLTGEGSMTLPVEARELFYKWSANSGITSLFNDDPAFYSYEISEEEIQGMTREELLLCLRFLIKISALKSKEIISKDEIIERLKQQAAILLDNMKTKNELIEELKKSIE